MSLQIKPIKLYGGLPAPNPLKVGIILTVLNIPFEIENVEFSKVKTPSYEAINPNGRVPSIYDPNTDLTIWESGAIIEYLIERYDDKEPRKLSFAPRTPEAAYARQWLYFQVSGQGPYYGQAYWFKKFHAEKLPSAVERYVNETKRVTGVLDKWLAKQKEIYSNDDKSLGDGPWLVGNKLSYADLAFIPWQRAAETALVAEGFDPDAFPYVKDWLERMTGREDVKKVLDEATKAREEGQKK
jgi:glutathione S-transferase